MRWSGNLAYVIGLIVTDGNLSKDGRHIELTSKDKEQIETFSRILNLKNKIGYKKSGYNPNGVYYRIQFGNVKLYRFLIKIGLTPNKTKTIGQLTIPDKYFDDFLRGHLDGDGYTTSFYDSIFKNSYRLYTGFVSASELHLRWLRHQIERLYGLKGSFRYSKGAHTFQLRYAKKASIRLLGIMYHKKKIPYLKRKHSKIMKALSIIDKKNAGVMKW
ncbi:MAG: LAGLIDADG family homing endonuclease [Candidatus Daviesbacteria bacterium]|nr:LAGLIDADG family homing endonuclease [Candidatus Daviesbacteria bacterium]